MALPTRPAAPPARGAQPSILHDSPVVDERMPLVGPDVVPDSAMPDVEIAELAQRGLLFGSIEANTLARDQALERIAAATEEARDGGNAVTDARKRAIDHAAKVRAAAAPDEPAPAPTRAAPTPTPTATPAPSQAPAATPAPSPAPASVSPAMRPPGAA